MAIRIFRQYLQLPLVLLALVEIALFFFAPYLAALKLEEAPDISPFSAIAVRQGTAFALLMFLMMAAMGLYHARQRTRFTGVLLRIIAAVCVAAPILLGLDAIIPTLAFADKVVPLAAILALACAALVRLGFDRILDERVLKRKIIVYGAGRRASSIAQLRRRTDRRGFLVMGYVPADGDDPLGVEQVHRISPGPSLLDYCKANMIDEIVVAMDDRRRSFPMDELLECRLDGIEVTDLVTFLERETGKVRLDVLNPSWMIFSEGFRRGRIHATFERMFDVVASVCLLIAAFPVMFVTALAIKLEDGPRASVFYRQVRVGQSGRPFKLLKFRSMREDAEREGRPVWAAKNDSRVTRVGSFIRKTRIDELPQILNVVRGEMSFVGPRPERPEFVSQLNERIPYYRERHTLKPGITGWAQVCYPYGSSEQDAIEKLQYDLYYVKNHSLLFYIAVLVQTVEVILWGKGAR